MTNLQELREVIIKAQPNPDLYDKSFVYSDENMKDCVVNVPYTRPIDLAMVLVALNVIKEVGFDHMGYFIDPLGFEYTDYAWDLTKDLDNQEPETILSLLKLLTNKQ